MPAVNIRLLAIAKVKILLWKKKQTKTTPREQGITLLDDAANF
jgi:hypothetical protein